MYTELTTIKQIAQETAIIVRWSTNYYRGEGNLKGITIHARKGTFRSWFILVNIFNINNNNQTFLRQNKQYKHIGNQACIN